MHWILSAIGTIAFSIFFAKFSRRRKWARETERLYWDFCALTPADQVKALYAREGLFIEGIWQPEPESKFPNLDLDCNIDQEDRILKKCPDFEEFGKTGLLARFSNEMKALRKEDDYGLNLELANWRRAIIERDSLSKFILNKKDKQKRSGS